MLKLYGVSDEVYATVELMLEESGGEITPEIEQFIAAGRAEGTIQTLVALIKNARLEYEALDGEIRRLREMREKLEARGKKFTELLSQAIPVGEKWTDGVHKVSYRKSTAVELTGEDVPEVYLRKKVIVDVDKETLSRDLKAGATVPGATLVTRNHLQVK